MMVLESVKDIKAGKGRDYNEFFDELEKRYKNNFKRILKCGLSVNQ